MKQGFLLLDVVIGTMIAAIVMMMLTTSLSQMTKFQFVVDDLCEYTLRMTIVHQQLTKDISGIFCLLYTSKLSCKAAAPFLSIPPAHQTRNSRWDYI